MAKKNDRQIPICPPLSLMVANVKDRSPISGEIRLGGNVLQAPCLQERCGWWNRDAGECSVASMGRAASLNL